MRVAICISGDIRQFKSCYPSFRQNVLEEINYFGHSYDIFYRGWESKIPHYKKAVKNEGTIQEFLDLFKPLRYQIDVYNDFVRQHLYQNTMLNIFQKNLKCNRPHKGPKCTYCGGEIIHNVIGMLYNIYQCHKLTKFDVQPYDYDYYIRTRPDCFYFNKLKKEYFGLQDKEIFIPSGYDSLKEYGGGVNDQVAIGTATSMGVYANTFEHLYHLALSNIHEYGCFGLPHSGIEKMLTLSNIHIFRDDFRYVLFKKKDLFMIKRGLELSKDEYRLLTV